MRSTGCSAFRRLLGFALIVWASGALAAGPPSTAPVDGNTDIDVRASKDGDTVLVEVDLAVRASQAEVWGVLTDYDHMADFISDLASSAVIARSGNTLDVMQKGTARYGLLSFPFETVRRVLLTPQSEIRSRIMSGDMMGSQIVTRIAANGPMTQVSVRSRYIPTIWLPPLIGTSVIASQTRKQWATLREEILRRRAPAAGPSAGL